MSDGRLQTKTRKRIESIVNSIAAAEGLELWGLEYTGGRGRPVLRVYVDAPDQGAKGPTIDQCASLSRALGVALDVEDAVPGAYTLEVSSPGLERPFFHPGQMRDYVGREVDVILTAPLPHVGKDKPHLADRKRYKGELVAVDEAGPTVRVDKETVRIDWKMVKKAKLIHHFPEPKKPGGGKKKKA